MTKKDLKKIGHFLYEVGTLRKIARAHRQTLLEDDISDSISSHSYRVTIIGWFLAKMEGADPNKVIKMCLFHDIAEVRSGDHNWVHKKYVKTFEDEIIKDQIKPLPWGDELFKIISEYEERDSKESHIAKDADLIDQILLLKEYSWRGNKEADKWLEGKVKEKRFKTKGAIKLVKEIMSQNPSDWWKNIWTNVNR